MSELEKSSHLVRSVAKVSIGLPVWNGKRYLEEALRSLVEQDYPNLEIVVSDNASTDRTLEILADFASRYKTNRLIIQTETLAATDNFTVGACSKVDRDGAKVDFREIWQGWRAEVRSERLRVSEGKRREREKAKREQAKLQREKQRQKQQERIKQMQNRHCFVESNGPFAGVCVALRLPHLPQKSLRPKPSPPRPRHPTRSLFTSRPT